MENVRTHRGLTRSRDDRILAGVCGGIAGYLGWSPTVVRVGYVTLSILSSAFPGLIVYLVLALAMPLDERY
jgi:phage shock protein C